MGPHREESRYPRPGPPRARGVPSEALRPTWTAELEDLGQPVDVAVAHQVTSHPVLDDVERAAVRSADDRLPERHCF